MGRRKNRHKGNKVSKQTPIQQQISEFTGAGKATGGGTYQTYSTCTHRAAEPLWVLPKGGCVYAGQKSSLRDGFDVILDCTGTFTQTSGVAPIKTQGPNSEKYSHLIMLGQKPATRISIDWDDGGKPPVQPEFWRVLARDVEGDMAVCCVGGHGRTGTALAALYLGQYALVHEGKEPDPLVTLEAIVQFIRDEHCEDAVETAAQVTYLMGLAKYYNVPLGKVIIGSYSAAYVGSSNAAVVAPATRVSGNITNNPQVYTGGTIFPLPGKSIHDNEPKATGPTNPVIGDNSKKYDYDNWNLNKESV